MQSIPKIRRWHPVTRPPALPPGALHLWRIRTGADGAPLGQLWPLLSQQESDHARRFRFERGRERYVRAHAGLRGILSGYLNLEPQAIPFAYAGAGKPHLDGSLAGLDFNLTDSGSLALVALSREAPIGVDCEQIRDRRNLTGIARRMFAEEEASRIAEAAGQDRLELFYIAWTALEAKVKTDGRGLFGGREPAARTVLQIGHCAPAHGFVAAVARASLPPVADWSTLELSTG